MLLHTNCSEDADTNCGEDAVDDQEIGAGPEAAARDNRLRRGDGGGPSFSRPRRLCPPFSLELFSLPRPLPPPLTAADGVAPADRLVAALSFGPGSGRAGSIRCVRCYCSIFSSAEKRRRRRRKKRGRSGGQREATAAPLARQRRRRRRKRTTGLKKKKKKKKNHPSRRFFLFLGGVAAREGGGGMGARRPVRKVEGLGEGRRGEEVFEKKGKIHPSSCASVPELVSGRTATTNIRIKCYIDALSSLENSVEEMQKTKR